MRRLLPLLTLLPLTLHAHPGHEAGGLGAGLLHPVTGVDHLLAMVAVGLWAGQLGGSARWQLPLAFVAAMVIGALVGINGVTVAGVEGGIAASVLLLGLLLALALRLPRALQLGAVALFAVLHGLAHGAELPAHGGAFAFITGFVATTAALHGVGLAAAQLLPRRAIWLRWAGIAIAAVGGGLLLS